MEINKQPQSTENLKKLRCKVKYFLQKEGDIGSS